MPATWPLFRSLGMAVLLTGSATLLRYVSNPVFRTRSPLLFHAFAVAVAAQYGGMISGLTATVLGVLATDYLFIAPVHSLKMAAPGDAMAMGVFTVVGVGLSFFGERRKRAEDELARIRHNLETAQRIASIGSWESDLITEKLWWSAETYNIFGVPDGSPLKTSDFFESVHPEDRARVREAVTKAIETRGDYDVEHRIVRRSDGRVRSVHQQAKLIQHNGLPVRMIGSIKDTTDTRRGEMAEQILGGLLQVCSACRRIRDANSDEWYSMEGYLRRHSAAEFSHGMCPDCGRQWYQGDEQL